jgi:DNA replication protein DnaC
VVSASDDVPCPLCGGTQWKEVEEASSNSRGAVRRVVRCDCWHASVSRQRLAAANIPKRYLHCSIANFTAYNESLERAAAQARRIVDAFPIVERGLFLEGQPGVGKTHLAVAVLKAVIEASGARGLFYDTRDLLRVIRSTYDPSIRTTELEVLSPVMTADLLVLDDLGAEKTSEWVEETMNLIVNTRYNERKLTIFTSNYPDIPDDTEPNALVARIGHRMRSRLHEMCEFVALDAADYRERPQNAGPEDLVAMWKMRKKTLPSPARGGRQARAQLRDPSLRDGRADLKWPGGRAGS